MNLEQVLTAPCTSAPLDIFFPDGGDDYAAALSICAACPAKTKAACLELALTTEQPSGRFGVFGGKTPSERAALADRIADEEHTFTDRRPSRATYARGCRCIKCRAENAAYMRGRRNRRAAGN